VDVGTGTTPVTLGTVQAQGKKAMPAADWARGLRLSSAARFDVPAAADAAPAVDPAMTATPGGSSR
jgi:hypothetical protein